MEQVVILGTGLAGYGVAREFRKHDKETPLVMVSRDNGDNYYKPDISEARGQQKTPADLVRMTAGKAEEKLQARLVTGSTVEQIDCQTRQLRIGGAAPIAYGRLVLACGADPVRLSFRGDAAEAVYHINSLTDYRRFCRELESVQHVAIIGAGLIGCEFANDLAQAGLRVSVIDPAHSVLSQLVPIACGEAVQTALQPYGVSWYLDRAATAINYVKSSLCVTLDDGEEICADRVLCAVGLRPSVQLATDAGLRVNGGVVVNRSLQTNDPHIYAIGDCAEVDGHWRPYVAPLMQCARTLGKNLSLAGKEKANRVKYPALPVIIKTNICPVIAYAPVEKEGRWIVEGEGTDQEARFVAEDGRILGFALTGKATKKRGHYLRQVPALMP